jgi:hypothetical protein
MHDVARQKINRLDELMALARQRYLKAGGNPHCTPSGMKGEDFLTDEERQEALALARELFNENYLNQYLKQKLF